MKTGQKEFGRCVICGIQKELTKEHIPPKCVFNKENYKMVNGLDILTADTFPWDGGEFKTKTVQGGITLNTLCRECNTKMGNLYTRAYKYFIMGLHYILWKSKPEINTAVHLIEKKIKPLNIFKQIVSMFNSLNKGLFESRNFDIGEFLSNPTEKTFCSGIYFYIYFTSCIQHLPMQAKVSIAGQGLKNKYSSEIAHHPLGIIMTIDHELQDEACINSFLNFDYDQEADLEMLAYFRERNLPIIGNYITQKELTQISIEEREKKTRVRVK